LEVDLVLLVDHQTTIVVLAHIGGAWSDGGGFPRSTTMILKEHVPEHILALLSFLIVEQSLSLLFPVGSDNCLYLENQSSELLVLNFVRMLAR
jgi:hypothetical protein